MRETSFSSDHILDRLYNKPISVTIDLVFATFCHVIPQGDYTSFLQNRSQRKTLFYLFKPSKAGARLCFICSNKTKDSARLQTSRLHPTSSRCLSLGNENCLILGRFNRSKYCITAYLIRTLHRYREIMVSNPVEALNCFRLTSN